MDFPPNEDFARIKVVAAGEAGARIATRLGSLIAGVECLPDSASPDGMRIAMAAADMVIIVSGLEDAAAAGRAAGLAELARDSKRCQVSIALVTESSVARSGSALAAIAALRCTVDAFFALSRDCLVPLDEQAPSIFTTAALENYLVRLQASDLARIITERGLICVDFADVRAIMRDGGSAACLGVGIASGGNAPGAAALKALCSLARQGLDPAESPAMLVSVTGSTNVTMDDFDAASKFVHEAINDDCNIIFSLLIDDALAGNIRVLIMAKAGFGKDLLAVPQVITQ